MKPTKATIEHGDGRVTVIEGGAASVQNAVRQYYGDEPPAFQSGRRYVPVELEEDDQQIEDLATNEDAEPVLGLPTLNFDSPTVVGKRQGTAKPDSGGAANYAGQGAIAAEECEEEALEIPRISFSK